MITKDQVKQIIELKKTMTEKQVAKHLKCSVSKVKYWTKKARIKGYTITKQKSGRKSIL